MTVDQRPTSSGRRTESGGVRLPAAERRRQLLRVARTVFAARGFYETTMADIADAAGVTKPVLYQHFDSKRDLYTAVLRDTGDRLRTAVITAAANAEGPRQQVAEGFEAYVSFVETDTDGFNLLFSSTSRQDDEWAEITAEVEESLAAEIADLIDVPEISPAHRSALAHGILGQAEGMMRYWQSGSSQELDRNDLLANLVSLAWGGLRGLNG